MKTIRAIQGKNEVVTTVSEIGYSSRLYVNVDHANGDYGDATLVCAKHCTEAGARRWAAKQLAA